MRNLENFEGASLKIGVFRRTMKIAPIDAPRRELFYSFFSVKNGYDYIELVSFFIVFYDYIELVSFFVRFVFLEKTRVVFKNIGTFLVF